MAKKPTITPTQLAEYDDKTLREIEQIALELREDPAKKDSVAYRVAHRALTVRQRKLKAEVATFELTNDHHLVFYDSTAGFAKMIGRSVLFFSMTVADRLHWRYTVKADSDHYSVSSEGIISFRSMEHLAELLAEIDIHPDKTLSTAEIHYFTLPKVYTDEQIESLRDSSRVDLDRINDIILPQSPLPNLYAHITEVSNLIYNQFKHISDAYGRDVIGTDLVKTVYEMHSTYLTYASCKTEDAIKYLATIIKLARHLRQGFAFSSCLHLLHHRNICRVLDHIVSIEEAASAAYRKRLAEQKSTTKKSTTNKHVE